MKDERQELEPVIQKSLTTVMVNQELAKAGVRLGRLGNAAKQNAQPALRPWRSIGWKDDPLIQMLSVLQKC